MPNNITFEAKLPGTDPFGDDYRGRPFAALEQERGTAIFNSMTGYVMLDYYRRDASGATGSERQAVATAPMSGGLAVAAVLRGEDPADVSVLFANQPLLPGYNGAASLEWAITGQEAGGRVMRHAVLLAPVHDWTEADPEASGKLLPAAAARIDDYQMALSGQDGRDADVVHYLPRHYVALGQTVPYSGLSGVRDIADGTLLAEIRTEDDEIGVGIYANGHLQAAV